MKAPQSTRRDRRLDSLGAAAINSVYMNTRPRVVSPAERARLREALRDADDDLRRLLDSERERG